MGVTFKGMGHQLNAGTQKGDVKLTVITKPHAHFVRRGVDLVYTHKLGLSQALVGHTLEVTLLNGHTIAVPVPRSPHRRTRSGLLDVGCRRARRVRATAT